MNATPVSAGLVASRPAWRSLLWVVALVAAWIALIYWQPVIRASGVPTTAHQSIVPATPGINPGTWPYVLTPAFVVPNSILLHALSLRQLIRRRTR
jgi:hypothetical protein